MGSALTAGTDFSFTGFRNAKTGERIAVGFLPVTGALEVDAMMLMAGLSVLPVGDEWKGVAPSPVTGSVLDDPLYEATRVTEDGSIRLDVRSKDSGAAISMFFEQRGQTVAVLAAANPHEPAHEKPGEALLDRLLPTFVWPASAHATPAAAP